MAGVPQDILNGRPDFDPLDCRLDSGPTCENTVHQKPASKVPTDSHVYHTEHTLKSRSMFFYDILSGDRTSDIRWTGDRRFKVGDRVLLKEWDPVKGIYTGRAARVVITYIQQNKSNPCAISHDAIRDEYAILSIKLEKVY